VSARRPKAPKAPAIAVPEEKISATLARFVEPALRTLGGAPSEGALRELFTVAVAVWNAHALAMPAWGDPSALERVRAHLRGPDAPLHHAHVFTVLSDRREALFADDPRFVREWELTIAPGQPFALRCKAAIPTGKPRSAKPEAAASRP
jgi:hypothetical protein